MKLQVILTDAGQQVVLIPEDDSEANLLGLVPEGGTFNAHQSNSRRQSRHTIHPMAYDDSHDGHNYRFCEGGWLRDFGDNHERPSLMLTRRTPAHQTTEQRVAELEEEIQELLKEDMPK